MKTILLFGAGKSATALIDYLVKEADANQWHILVADANREQILAKTNNAPATEAIAADINDAEQRQALIKRADIVISMMPPALHILVARDCIDQQKHLLTASYIDPAIKELSAEIADKNLIFLYEMGLDPGIDHMSAMKLFDEIRAKGGHITSFKSHCGGLVAPESDDNPWHYKISWNPRNVVLAGKAGAIYKLNNNLVKEDYKELFDPERAVRINDEILFLSYYPNRDSLGYIELYQLDHASTFMRTTLRYPDFMYGWNNLVELDLTSETDQYETDGLTLAAFFKQHFDKVNFGDWLNKKLAERLGFAKKMAEDLIKLEESHEELMLAKEEDSQSEIMKDFTIIDEAGELQKIDIEDIKTRGANAIAQKMHEANLTLKQIFYLGADDDQTLINKGKCSAAEVLQFALETKLKMQPHDKDMIVMLHEIGFELNGKNSAIRSSLVVKGEDSLRTAMAKTVGLPLGIAAKLILEGKIVHKGLQIPVSPSIYLPVLEELDKMGISFSETEA